MLKKLWPGVGQDLFVNAIIGSTLIPRPARRYLLRAAGFHVGHAVIEPHVYWFGRSSVVIGDGVYINRRVTVNHSADVVIGKNVAIGPECQILTASHEIGPSEKRCGASFIAPVTIGDGAWIGAKTIILPGVTIGPGVIVGAGSVVTTSLRPDRVYAGAPAREIRSLEAADPGLADVLPIRRSAEG